MMANARVVGCVLFGVLTCFAWWQRSGSDPLSRTKRTIFIGDIHGCSDELVLLLQRLTLGPEDHVVVLGDVIGKGPAPYSVLQWVQRSRYAIEVNKT